MQNKVIQASERVICFAHTHSAYVVTLGVRHLYLLDISDNNLSNLEETISKLDQNVKVGHNLVSKYGIFRLKKS
jgi:hypothetical protein